jgi:methylmalonyl-CoA mutase cobalamin-binding subunit
VVVTCVEQEWHALPALLVAEHLRHAGLPVSYLGANASAEHLVRHVHDSSARAVALSCSLSSSLLRVRHQVEAVRATGTPVLVGGAAFDAAGRRATVLGANAFAATGAEAAEAVARLPEAVPRAPVLQHAGALEAASVHADREQLVLSLRRRLDERTRSTEATPAWAAAVHDHLPQLVGALAGGLVVDDASVLEETAGWLDEVLAHRDAPTGTVAELLTDLGRLVSELPAAHALVSEVTRRRAG